MKILEWCGYPMVKKFWIYLLISTEYMNVTDSWMDRQTDTAQRHRLHLCIASRGRNE